MQSYNYLYKETEASSNGIFRTLNHEIKEKEITKEKFEPEGDSEGEQDNRKLKKRIIEKEGILRINL